MWNIVSFVKPVINGTREIVTKGLEMSLETTPDKNSIRSAKNSYSGNITPL
jgi:hypothetical protein